MTPTTKLFLMRIVMWPILVAFACDIAFVIMLLVYRTVIATQNIWVFAVCICAYVIVSTVYSWDQELYKKMTRDGPIRTQVIRERARRKLEEIADTLLINGENVMITTDDFFYEHFDVIEKIACRVTVAKLDDTKAVRVTLKGENMFTVMVQFPE